MSADKRLEANVTIVRVQRLLVCMHAGHIAMRLLASDRRVAGAGSGDDAAQLATIFGTNRHILPPFWYASTLDQHHWTVRMWRIRVAMKYILEVLNSGLQYPCISLVHPSRDSAAAEPGRETETSRAHGKVADKIPDQTYDLDDGRYECEDCAV